MMTTRDYSRKRPATYPAKRSRTGYTRQTYIPRSFISTEWKYLDVAINQAVNTTGTQTLVNGLAPGTGASERVGMKVTIRSVQIRTAQYVTSGTGVDQFQRLVLFVDRQANGAAPTLGAQLSANSILGQRSLVSRKRFKILWDTTRHLNATAEAGSMYFDKLYLKFKRPYVVEYNTGVAGTIADIVSNSFYLYAVGSVAAGASAGAVEGLVRIRYTDS